MELKKELADALSRTMWSSLGERLLEHLELGLQRHEAGAPPQPDGRPDGGEMADREPHEKPTNPLGHALKLHLEVEVGVIGAADVVAWQPGHLVVLPELGSLSAALHVGDSKVAVGRLEQQGDRLAVRIVSLQ